MQLGVLLQEMKDNYLINPTYLRFWSLMKENNYKLSGVVNEDASAIEIRLDDSGNVKFRRNGFFGIKKLSHQWLVIYTLYYKNKSNKNPVLCMDCGKDIFSPGYKERGDYFMVNDDIWNKVVTSPNEDYCVLCKSCLEKRLGRELTIKDYMQYKDAPVNDFIFGEKI